MNIQSAIVGRLMLLCAIVGVAGCTRGTEIQEYSKSYAVSGRAQVHVHALDARVRVLTSDEPKVDFRVRYETSVDADRRLHMSSKQNGDVVELTANEESRQQWNWGGSSRNGVIEVRMPKDADLEVETSNGAIEVTSVNGRITLRSSNGAMRLTALKGTLRADTSNGAISADHVDGDCEFSTSNGSIKVAGRFDSLDLHSSNGEVVVRVAAGSKVAGGWDIGTSNARIDLAVPGDLKADLNVATSNGSVQLGLPLTVQGDEDRSHLHGALNGGGPEVSVHTSNGHIRVSANPVMAGSVGL